MSKFPNILFLMADELRGDVTGFGGNNVIRTPSLDTLSKNSTVFDNAYTPAPVCIPARQCIAAGQFPSTCNCLKWYDDLEPNYLTFPRLLSQYGYSTVACGKLHHVGPDQMQGYTKRFGMECEVVDKYIPDLKKGYDAFSSKWSQQQEVENATSDVKTFHIRQDEIAVECAESFIEQYFSDEWYGRSSPERPLLLTVSFNQPHYPYVASPDLFDYYLPKVVPYVNQKVSTHPFLSKFAVNASEDTLRRATAAYYSMTEKMDSYIGRVFEALKRVNQDLDDWLVIFTSDHGEMLGQHGVWEKQKFYEGSARVPLLIKMPYQKKMFHCAKNVNLCDLYATICSVANLPIPDGLDSRDLTPLIKGECDNWNNESISIYDGENIMIKKDSLKYHFYKNDNSEILFDLEVDKKEEINFLAEAKYLGDKKYSDFLKFARKRIQDFGFFIYK